jgi:hypothetical protein
LVQCQLARDGKANHSTADDDDVMHRRERVTGSIPLL